MNKKAFSLIEVIIAAWILSMTFFWVYKLIWENSKIISNSYDYSTANTLFQPFKECIETNSWNTLIIWNKTFYIWLNWCNISNSITWITLNNIDYILYSSWKSDNSYDLIIKFNWQKLKENFILK
jgi:hypothetical protein